LLPSDASLRRLALIILTAVPLAFGAMALILDQDANWDLRNYHWYNAYAVVDGRFDQDMGAAQTPTYYNPTLDVPFYVLAQALPARAFGFVLGALQGCNFILLYIMAWLTLRFDDARAHVFAAAAVALTGIIGGGHMGMVGALFYDNIVSLFIFAAMIVILSNTAVLQTGAWSSALARVAFAGLLVGFAVGFKLPTQIFAVGVCFGLLFVPGAFVRRFVLSFVCGLGIIAGFAVFGGWWLWELWSHFGNPLFPYFNDVIRSPWALPESYRDARFLPKTVAEALTLSFHLFADGKVGGEVPFRDGRILALYIVLLATPAMLLIARLRKSDVAPFADVFAARYIAAVAALSYAVWLGLFAIYRYLVPLEMLAPLVIVACIAFWPVGRVRRASLAIGMLGFVTITAQPADWGRVPWQSGWGVKFVATEVPPLNAPAETLVLMTGLAPTAFVIPAFPSEVTFLRPHSYLVEPDHDTLFAATIRKRIAAHRGDIYLLQAVWEKWAADKTLTAYGLAFVPGGCRAIRSNLDDEVELCALARVASDLPR